MLIINYKLFLCYNLNGDIMFVKAIKNGRIYTKPFITGQITYAARQVLNEINTVMVLNNEGDLLTCSHVADAFLVADDINEVFPNILKEIKTAGKREIKKIEIKYGIKKDTIIAIHNILIDIANNPGRLNIIKHEYLDLAIIKMENKTVTLVENFPVFDTSIVEPGTVICGLGYTFPEFDTFLWDEANEKIITTNKFMNFPIFPLNGMVTRNVADQNNEITMFEISVPILPGQNGGPTINEEGNVIGILVGTKRITSYYTQNMPLTFDLGLVIDSKTIVKFLDKNNIKYNKLAK